VKIKDYETEILALVEENKKLVLENESLRDENESLWFMLDEIKKADIEKYTHLLEELELQIKLKSLMYTSKKGYA
jgi:regulator of replication initiation timing